MSILSPLTSKLLESSMDKVFEEVYDTWGGDERIDGLIAKELLVPVFCGVRLTKLVRRVNALMHRQEELPLTNIWRVEIRDNHMLHLSDFTMPSASDRMRQIVKLNDAPKFIRDALAVLQISQDGTLIEKVGKRISDSVFYIIEGETDGEHTREEGERCG